MNWWNIFLTIVILSPLCIVLPIVWYLHSKEKRDAGIYDSGSDIGISGNYWAD